MDPRLAQAEDQASSTTANNDVRTNYHIIMYDICYVLSANEW